MRQARPEQFGDARVVQDLLRRSEDPCLPEFQHQRMIGDLQGRTRILLDQQDRDAGGA